MSPGDRSRWMEAEQRKSSALYILTLMVSLASLLIYIAKHTS